MQIFFTNHSAIQNKQLDKEVYQELEQFYNSFFNNIYNELNIGKYRKIRDAISLVMRKFDCHDHPLAYTGKLVMYIQVTIALEHLHLTCEQQNLLQLLGTNTKKINLNFVYSGPITDLRQFKNS